MLERVTPVHWQRLEALFLFAGAIAAVHFTGESYWWLALILVPDLFIAGYLGGNVVGAFVYNLGHTYALPIILGIAGLAAGTSLAVALALVWLAHIGMDRMLAYGLKETTGFHHTHLGDLTPGRRRGRPGS